MVNSTSPNFVATAKRPRAKQTSDYDDTAIAHLSTEQADCSGFEQRSWLLNH